MICKPQISSCINLKLPIQAACTVFLIFCLTIHPPLDTKYFKKKKANYYKIEIVSRLEKMQMLKP